MGKSLVTIVITAAVTAVTTATALHYLDYHRKQEATQHSSPSQTIQQSYEEWLVQEHLALPRSRVLQLVTSSSNYRLSDDPNSTYCMRRVSNNVTYQVGFTDPTSYNDVTETLSGKPGSGHMLRQNFSKRGDMGTTLKDGRTIDKGVQTRFFDYELDSVADKYELWEYDALGEERVMPIPTRKESIFVSVNKKARDAFAEKADPRNIGDANFEIMRQENYTEALLRFLNDPAGNKACKFFGEYTER